MKLWFLGLEKLRFLFAENLNNAFFPVCYFTQVSLSYIVASLKLTGFVLIKKACK